MKKAVVHFEIGVPNFEEAVDFYEKVFNWKITSNGNSGIIDTGRENAIP